MTMNNVNDRHEFRANLPWIDKINPEALAFRAKNGITKTLAKATDEVLNSAEGVSKTKSLIASCNFSASQCVKEIKRRGLWRQGMV